MKVYIVKFNCRACRKPEFPMLVVADSEDEAREQAQRQADADCDQQHTILSVEESIYEPHIH